MNTHNIKLTLRSLSRNKLYSLLSISGFAVGFAVCILTALYIFSEFTKDHCFPEYERIVRVIDTKNKYCNLDYKLNDELKDKYPEIESSCPLELETGWDIKVRTDAIFTRFQGMICTTNDFFTLFPLKVLKSAGKFPFTGMESVVLTESMAKRLFNNVDPIGKSIEIKDILQGQVSAVIEDFPAASGMQASMLINSANKKLRLSQNCNNNVCMNPTNHFLLLRKGADLSALQSKINRNILKKYPEIGKIGFQRLADIYFDPPLDGNSISTGNKSLVWVFFSIGLVVLLLSTINFLNFYLSMQFTKLREIGIKKINGASYGQLLTYSFSEVSVSILLSVVLALAVVSLVLPVANQSFGMQLKLTDMLTPIMALIFLLIIILIIVVNSIAPVYILSKFNSGLFLQTMKSGNSRQLGRKILTLVQFTASMILITIVIAFYQQISFSKNAYLGFDKENLVRLNLPFKFKNLDAVRQQLDQLPFCRSVTFSAGVPGEINVNLGEYVDNKPILFKCIEADNNFLKTMGIKLKSGRTFANSETNNACLLNEEALKQYGWTDITDKRFKNGKEGGYPVVGITEDFHVESLHTKIEPVCIIFKDMNKAYNSVQASIRLSPGDIHTKMKQIEKVWKSVIPDEPMDYNFYDEHFNAMYKKDEQMSNAIGMVAIIALVLTFMGILGQSFQISLSRTKEIGIRKVNGATVLEILVSLNREYLVWLLASFVIAVPVAYYFIHKWLGNFAYKASISWMIFAAAGLIVFATVFITVTLQSKRTATRNPVDALRHE